jgi:hypothetical protein
MEYESESQMKLLDAMREFLTSPGASLTSAFDKFASVSRRKIYFAAAAISAAVSAVLSLMYLRRREGMKKRSRDEALKIRFVGAMRRRGFEKKPGDGLDEFVRAVREKSESDSKIAAAAGRFVELFEGFYFRDIPIPPAALAELDGIIRSIGRG